MTGASALADVADMDGIPLALSTEDDHIRADDDGVHRPVWDDEDDKDDNEEDGAPRGRRWRGRREKDDDEEWRPKEGGGRRQRGDDGDEFGSMALPTAAGFPPMDDATTFKSTTSRGDRLR